MVADAAQGAGDVQCEAWHGPGSLPGRARQGRHGLPPAEFEVHPPHLCLSYTMKGIDISLWIAVADEARIAFVSPMSGQAMDDTGNACQNGLPKLPPFPPSAIHSLIFGSGVQAHSVGEAICTAVVILHDEEAMGHHSTQGAQFCLIGALPPMSGRPISWRDGAMHLYNIAWKLISSQ